MQNSYRYHLTPKALETLNDIVYIERNEKDSELLVLKEHPAFSISICRDQSAKKMLAEASSILYGDVLQSDRFVFDFKYELGQRRYKYRFNFIDNELPHRINILIGKNGAGKSQTLLTLSKYFLLPKETVKESNVEVSDHPNFISNLMVVAYNPHEDFLVPKEGVGKLPIEYKYLGFKRYVGDNQILDTNTPALMTYTSIRSMYKRDRNNFAHNIQINDFSLMYLAQEYIKKAIPEFCCFALKLKGNNKQNYMDKFNFVDSEDSLFDDYMKLEFSEEQREFHAVETSDFDEVIYYIDQHDELLHLSSGQKIFSYLVINTLSIIKQNSLILIDEPETALHPNLEIDFMTLLKSILDRFDSFAIIATHSAIVTREIPRDFVHVIKIDEDEQPIIEKPTINTFGMNIGTLTNYVFDDVFVQEKPYKEWIKDQKKKYQTFTSFEEHFQEKLGYDFLLQCRNLWDTI